MAGRLAQFARTKGAKDKRKRQRRGTGDAEDKTVRKLKNLELGTRSVGNLSRGINAITRAVEQGRMTAKYLGYVPGKVAKERKLKNAISLISSSSQAGNRVLSLGRNIIGLW